MALSDNTKINNCNIVSYVAVRAERSVHTFLRLPANSLEFHVGAGLSSLLTDILLLIVHFRERNPLGEGYARQSLTVLDCPFELVLNVVVTGLLL